MIGLLVLIVMAVLVTYMTNWMIDILNSKEWFQRKMDDWLPYQRQLLVIGLCILSFVVLFIIYALVVWLSRIIAF